MARSRTVEDAEAIEAERLAEIEAWYRHALAAPATVGRHRWEPIKLGPTWQHDADGNWLLPERSLGWGMLAWCGRWLQHERDTPWQFTLEQARFLLWWYALEPDGTFIFRDGVLQRLKGWGKDPIGACLCLFELCGPCRFGGWQSNGEPIGIEAADAWVQTAAVSLEQTKNTMRLLPGLCTDEAKERFDLQIGKEQVYAMGSTRLFQAVTSSPTTLEGARATFVLPNETQHWNSSNSGHDMADVIERNATKSPDGAARRLAITNAPEPGEDSVAERDRDAYDDVLAGRALGTGLLYDSLEAAPDAPLTPESIRKALGRDPDAEITREEIESVIAPVIESVRGDSVWLNVPRIIKSILDPRNSVSRSRRFWYNQTVAAEDAWVDPNRVKAAAVDAKIEPGEEIVMFGDGSKSDDATGLVACRVSDGLCQVLHVQQPKKDQIVNRIAVDQAVTEAFEIYKVTAFFFDPSHAKDDESETDNRFWWPLVDEWNMRYGKSLKLWATKEGPKRHAVAFDMLTATPLSMFVPAAEQLSSDIDNGLFAYAKSDWLREHLINTRRRITRYGVGVGKEHRESRHKIDLAVCAVGARMLWRMVLMSRVGRKQGTPGGGRVIVLK